MYTRVGQKETAFKYRNFKVFEMLVFHSFLQLSEKNKNEPKSGE